MSWFDEDGQSFQDYSNQQNDPSNNNGSTAVPYAPPPGTPGVDQNPAPYNPNATPNDIGGYATAPPIDTNTGTYQPGWSKGSDGLWRFADPNAPKPAPGPGGGGGGNGSGGGSGSSGNSFNNDVPMPNLANFASPDPLKPWTGTFTAPTAADVAATPGFQFDMDAGIKGLQRSAAAKGTLLTGGTLKATNQYATDYANTKYQDAYNNAYNTYESNRSDFLTNEANRYQSQFANNAQQWGINSDYFNMGQVNRQTDFNIFDSNRNFDFGVNNSNRNFNETLNNDYWAHQISLAALGRPPAPSI